MNGGNNGAGGPKPKSPGIHHANIRDKKKSVKRLKASFRKSVIYLTLDKDKRRVRSTAVLTEIMPKSAYVFVNEKISKNAILTLHLTEPLAIDVRGRVRYCEDMDRNNPISKPETRKSYRLLLEFTISSQSERDAMEDYYQQVRDENYVATKWHHYMSERAQSEVKLKLHENKIAEKVKEAKEQPELATEDMLVSEGDAAKKQKPDSGGGEQQAA